MKTFTHGGARPGAGKPRGRKWASTISKEAAREALRTEVIKQLEPLVQAQIDNAMGIRHTFMRDAQGRFVQLTDPKQIEIALNSGDEGKYYWTYTKDPNVQAFTDLMNRALGKPVEAVQVEQQGAIVIRWKDSTDDDSV